MFGSKHRGRLRESGAITPGEMKFWDFVRTVLQSGAFLAFYRNTLTTGTAFPRVPPRSDPWSGLEKTSSTRSRKFREMSFDTTANEIFIRLRAYRLRCVETERSATVADDGGPAAEADAACRRRQTMLQRKVSRFTRIRRSPGCYDLRIALTYYLISLSYSQKHTRTVTIDKASE